MIITWTLCLHAIQVMTRCTVQPNRNCCRCLTEWSLRLCQQFQLRKYKKFYSRIRAWAGMHVHHTRSPQLLGGQSYSELLVSRALEQHKCLRNAQHLSEKIYRSNFRSIEREAKGERAGERGTICFQGSFPRSFRIYASCSGVPPSPRKLVLEARQHRT